MAIARSVELILPSEIALIDLVHDTTEKLARLAGFSSEDALNISLAVREAVINAMLHGNGQDPARSVRVTWSREEGAISVRVTDQGAGFDPEGVPDATEGDQRLQSSGRGLLLMRAFVDEVEIRRRDDGGTEVSLVKKKPA